MPTEVAYLDDVGDVTESQLAGGFFEGWPVRPTPAKHLEHLRGAEVAIVALDPATDDVVGFVSAVGDGGLVAFVPWLEVLPAWRGRGIATALLTRLLERLGDRYSIDVVCDDDLVPFYERFGGIRLAAVGWRNQEVLA